MRVIVENSSTVLQMANLPAILGESVCGEIFVFLATSCSVSCDGASPSLAVKAALDKTKAKPCYRGRKTEVDGDIQYSFLKGWTRKRIR